MFTFCDVLHETKQKKANKLLRVRSTDWKSSSRYYSLQGEQSVEHYAILSVNNFFFLFVFRDLMRKVVRKVSKKTD